MGGREGNLSPDIFLPPHPGRDERRESLIRPEASRIEFPPSIEYSRHDRRIKVA